LLEGEIVGTWRRDQHRVTIQIWQRLRRGAREAVQAEAESLPLPGIKEPIVVRWTGEE
jgi:hypothetical protein